MSVAKASLWRRAALTLIAGAAIAAPMGARASVLGGLSVRVGGYFPTADAVRSFTTPAVWSAGVEYKIPWFPHVLNGEAWSTSISVDGAYSEHNGRIARFLPVAINQTYTFAPQGSFTPYAGFCVTGNTFNASAPGGVVQPTITRFGGGLILGLNWGKSVYFEGRYEWFDQHGLGPGVSIDGFRTYVGYRF